MPNNVTFLLPFGFSHQEDRWSEDHSERDKRQAEWDFSKDSFFCDVPGIDFKDVMLFGIKYNVNFIFTARANVKHLDTSMSVCVYMHAKTSCKETHRHMTQHLQKKYNRQRNK